MLQSTELDMRLTKGDPSPCSFLVFPLLPSHFPCFFCSLLPNKVQFPCSFLKCPHALCSLLIFLDSPCDYPLASLTSSIIQ